MERPALEPGIWRHVSRIEVTPRLARLHDIFRRRYAALGGRLFVEPEQMHARNQSLLTSWRASVGRPAIIRRAMGLVEFARSMPIVQGEEELIVGGQTFSGWIDQATQGELNALGYAGSTGHIVHDYGVLLARGLDGLLKDIASAQAAPEHRDNLDAFAMAIRAFALYIERHAQQVRTLAATLAGPAADDLLARAADLEHVAKLAPASFQQAMQLTWLAHTFLHAENQSSAISFGRLDQYLWPFLQGDLAAGRLTLDGAFEIVGAFFIKCCEGDESQNLVLGGVDESGRDSANVLSLIVLHAMAKLRTFQPSLCARMHKAASPDYRQACCELAAVGTGQPGFMNDAPVIAGLAEVGVPLARARDWAVVGCYEATTQGDCYPNTVLMRLMLVDVMAGYLQTTTARQATSYEAFEEGYFVQLAQEYSKVLAAGQNHWHHMAAFAPSPFGSVLMQPCVRRATPLEAAGAKFNLAGVNILGIGTLVDSLHAVRTLVFEQGRLGLTQLADAVAADFPDETLRRQLLSLPCRYGTGSESTDQLATLLSTRIARMVLESRMDCGVRPCPAFFAFSADIYSVACASPDGRRKGELISYGVAPAASAPKTPTSALKSASSIAHGLAACGCPMSISLSQSDLGGNGGPARIASLVESYFALGGSHVHFNVISADDLRAAQANPELHADLTVRVSGYSARFVQIDGTWQQAMIDRAEGNM